jgi:hypothetical protein
MIEHLLFMYLRTVLSRSWNELQQSTFEPARMQSQRLMDILCRNKDAAFGKEHHFSQIQSVKQFRECVPIRTYEQLEPYISRVRHGERNVLTAEAVEMFGRTSGTTREPKFIPITPSFYEEFSKMQKIWQRKLLEDHRRMARGKILSVMGAEIDGYTECGIPYGAMSGHSYRLQYPLTQSRYAVPYEVMCLKDFDAKYYLALRLALEQNVTTVAALNPSTILLLMKKLNLHMPDFTRDIADGKIRAGLAVPSHVRQQIEETLQPNRKRALELEAVAAKGTVIKATDVWKELAVVTTWQGGSLGFYIDQFSDYFPEIPLRDMGLIATEGYFSIPLWSNTPNGLLGITGHFFEFLPLMPDGSRGNDAVGAEELEIGKDYFVLVTTSGGLYRYDISDIVSVVGFFNRTPVIVFKQKGDNTVSITGEKLTETQVTGAMKRASDVLSSPIEGFVLALSLDDPPSYNLLVESPERNERLLGDLLSRFEHYLRLHNIEYADKRDSGRLGEPALCLVESGGFEQLRKQRVQQGAPDGQYKLPHLMQHIEQFRDFRYINRMSLTGSAAEGYKE